KGQTVVIPKRHMPSDSFKIEEEELIKLVRASRKVAKLLEKRLRVQRIHMVLEGLLINHLHAKLYPAIGLDQKEFKEIVAAENKFFKFYPGYISTLMGPRASDEELKRVQKAITG